MYIKLGHYLFLPQLSQFIIHCHQILHSVLSEMTSNVIKYINYVYVNSTITFFMLFVWMLSLISHTKEKT